MTYSAAVIGCGRIGSTLADDPLLGGDVMTHAEAYFLSGNTELIAVADVDSDARNRCASRWQVDASFASASEMIATAKPQIVSVCTPTSTHATVIREILESSVLPRAILCEKPIAESLEDAENLVTVAEEAGVVLLVVHMRRYARNIQNLRKFLIDGGIGELRGISGWLTKGTLHNGTHWFDLLRFLAGNVKSVSALNTLGESGADPTLDVSMTLDTGMLATMRAADAGNYTLCEMDILGSKGRARIVDSSYVIELSVAAESRRYSGYVELEPVAKDFGDRRDVMLHAVDDIVNCLNNGSQPISSGRDGVEALRIAVAAHQSAKTGMPVTISSFRAAAGAASTR